MPREFLFGDSFVLACRKKGLILADARCPDFLKRSEDKNDYIGDGLYIGDHTKSFGSMDWYRDVGVREGYVSISVEGL